MIKKIYILTIVIILFIVNQINAKVLVTSVGRFYLSTYNVAIVGNSHASFMSNYIDVDNDLNSNIVGNHSVGGDDLDSYGNSVPAYTDWDHGKELIANEGELKGWIDRVKGEAIFYDYMICWFGSNSTGGSANGFKNKYIKWISDVRKENKNCKIIIMAIPYFNNTDKDVNPTNADSVVDNFNLKIKEMIDELKDPNIFYEENLENIEYTDSVHFNKNSYIRIWNDLKEKYNIEVKKLID